MKARKEQNLQASSLRGGLDSGMFGRSDGLWVSLFQLRNFNWLLRNGTKGSPIRSLQNPQAVA